MQNCVKNSKSLQKSSETKLKIDLSSSTFLSGLSWFVSYSWEN